MKTVGSIIYILCFVFIVLNGAILLFNQAGANNALDDDSLKVISQYDKELQILKTNITANYVDNKNLTSYDPNSNFVGDQAKEFFETKDKVNQLRDTVKLSTKIPDLILLSIPFVDETDLEVYKLIGGLLIVIVIFIAIIMAIFGKFWGTQA